MNAEVVQAGCFVLGDLAPISATQDGIIGLSCINAVLDALGSFRSIEGVQEDGCRALSRLARVIQRKASIIDAGGLESIAAALRAHPENKNLLKHGCH